MTLASTSAFLPGLHVGTPARQQIVSQIPRVGRVRGLEQRSSCGDHQLGLARPAPVDSRFAGPAVWNQIVSGRPNVPWEHQQRDVSSW